MIIGIPKEIKDHENRVAAIPATVQALVARAHRLRFVPWTSLDQA